MILSENQPIEKTIEIKGDSEFLKIINGKPIMEVLFKMDELMEATQILHPRMYDRIIREISDI